MVQLLQEARWLHDMRAIYSNMCILGTSIAGTWAGFTIGNSHDYWIDEDPSRMGKMYYGKKTLSLDQVPANSLVAVVLGREKAVKFVSRVNSMRLLNSNISFKLPLEA